MSAVPETVKCDGCGKSRLEDSNRWKRLKADHTYKDGTAFLCIYDGLPTSDDDDSNFHACGETCLLKLVSRWCSTGKLDA